MEKRTHIYVSRKNVLTWLMALCLVGSAVARIVIACLKGSGESQNVWSQIVLPVAATLLYVLIVLLNGKEFFYKTAIPAFLLALYYAIRPHEVISSRFILSLYYTCLLFYFLAYTILTSGRIRYVWLLFPLLLSPLIALVYLHQNLIHTGIANAWMYVLPDYLLFGGCLLLTLALRVHPQGEYHPTWGDRTDGRRIRSLPAMSQVSPYIMVTRNTATNYFEESFEISHIDRYIRQKRKEGLTNFGITHVLLACYVRAICKFPGLNRFLAGQKVYSRGNDIQYCMTIKKEMKADSPDTVIKVHLDPHDTATDVYNKLQDAVEKVKNTPLDSNFDNTAGVLTLIPGVLLKFVVWLLRTLDYFGMLPKFLLEVSPFHGSLFFTSMGSLGIPPIYHHLYDFGNLPVFGAFGCKRRALEVLEDGTVVQRKYVDVKFCMDERIVDGYYYAAFFKHYKRLLQHPEVLDDPPEEVLRDID
ncbi:MAG: 2-oxo acid dehydrogenase subunit E2 [Oscillospiraceae bacterium]|nr:2-oxo acid dehydrogenase subunit E2 [Oscillospiraceae bacterium]